MTEKNNIEKLLDDSLNLGLGVFHYSREKIKSLVDEVVDRGETEREKIVDELMERGEAQREEIRKIVREELTNKFDLDEYVKKSEVEEIVREEVKRQSEVEL
ncbi:MAG: hypothetical protein Q4B36_05455 [Tissierellia bacterium]|nr:hypothetical protein [Tissierellia bacterium]